MVGSHRQHSTTAARPEPDWNPAGTRLAGSVSGRQIADFEPTEVRSTAQSNLNMKQQNRAFISHHPSCSDSFIFSSCQSSARPLGAAVSRCRLSSRHGTGRLPWKIVPGSAAPRSIIGPPLESSMGPWREPLGGFPALEIAERGSAVASRHQHPSRSHALTPLSPAGAG